MEIFNTFGLSDEDKVKIDVVIKKFEEYCTPKTNLTYERQVFNTRAHEATEGIDAYVTELRKLARNCQFGELHDSLIRDRIVCGIRISEARKRLLFNMKLDAGAQCNVFPYALYCKLTREKMRKSKTRLVSYTGHKIHVIGKATRHYK